MQVERLQRWIHRDPAGRGFLPAYDAVDRPCAGDLGAAAEDLSSGARKVGIVTGFFIPDAPTPAAETDGPIGAVLLADVLRSCGSEVVLITDEPCAPAIRAACRACLVDVELSVCPVPSARSQSWRSEFREESRRAGLSHLVSVERVGPALTAEPQSDRCLNMRGVPIDAWTADLYRLFEGRPAGVRTIGIGDGGNEIGMGRYWKQARASRNVPTNACRTETDWTILAGISDWGAMALAAAVALAKGDLAPLRPWTSARIEHGLTRMVADGPAIDGCTFLPEPTVDAVPFATYIQPWELIRRELRLDP